MLKTLGDLSCPASRLHNVGPLWKFSWKLSEHRAGAGTGVSAQWRRVRGRESSVWRDRLSQRHAQVSAANQRPVLWLSGQWEAGIVTSGQWEGSVRLEGQMRCPQIKSVSCQMFSNFQSAGQSKRELLKLSGECWSFIISSPVRQWSDGVMSRI